MSQSKNRCKETYVGISPNFAINIKIMQIVFFKRPQPRQFDYKPRYYDEEKERKEERRKAIEEGSAGNPANLKRDIERRWRRIDKKNRNKSKGINLLVYLIVAALLVYFVFFV